MTRLGARAPGRQADGPRDVGQALRGPAPWGWAVVGLAVWALCWAFWAAEPVGAQESAAVGSSQPLGWLGDVIGRHGLWVGLLGAFVGGLALNLTPCVYPMIPVTLAFFSGQGAGALRRTVGLASLYVMGIALSYAALGVLAAQTGALMGSWLQHPAVLVSVAVVIIALALSMFGLYELRPPQVLMQRLGQAWTGLLGAFLMGLVVGLVAAPCVGPFLVGLLLLVSQLASPVKGFLLFFTLGLGMGLPYLILAIVADRVSGLPKAGAWLVWTKKVLGCLLFGLALFFINPLIPGPALWAVVAALLLGAGIYLGWLERSRGRGRTFGWIKRLAGVALILAAGVVVWPKPPAAATVEWRSYTEADFEQAKQDRQPVLIDIYADWCLPCVEMDHVTFRHPDVVQALGPVTTLRVDATREIPAEAEALLERYKVFGVPTLLFFDREGEEREDLRLSGFIEPEKFLERLANILEH